MKTFFILREASQELISEYAGDLPKGRAKNNILRFGHNFKYMLVTMRTENGKDICTEIAFKNDKNFTVDFNLLVDSVTYDYTEKYLAVCVGDKRMTFSEYCDTKDYKNDLRGAVSKMMKKPVTEGQARCLASEQFGMLCAYLDSKTKPLKTYEIIIYKWQEIIFSQLVSYQSPELAEAYAVGVFTFARQNNTPETKQATGYTCNLKK